jgi:hypothetical protein
MRSHRPAAVMCRHMQCSKLGALLDHLVGARTDLPRPETAPSALVRQIRARPKHIIHALVSGHRVPLRAKGRQRSARMAILSVTASRKGTAPLSRAGCCRLTNCHQSQLYADEGAWQALLGEGIARCGSGVRGPRSKCTSRPSNTAALRGHSSAATISCSTSRLIRGRPGMRRASSSSLDMRADRTAPSVVTIMLLPSGRLHDRGDGRACWCSQHHDHFGLLRVTWRGFSAGFGLRLKRTVLPMSGLLCCNGNLLARGDGFRNRLFGFAGGSMA